MIVLMAVIIVGGLGLAATRIIPMTTMQPTLTTISAGVPGTIATSTFEGTVVITATPNVTATPYVTTTASIRARALDLYLVHLPLVQRAADRKLTTARARATATFEARLLATAQVQYSATVQAREDWRSQVEMNMQVEVTRAEGHLSHQPTDTTLKTEAASVKLRDFIVEARFMNPYAVAVGPWDYGFVFRHVGPNREYRLVVRSDGWWRLIDQAGEIGKLIYWGRVPNLDLREGSANALKLIVKDKRGQFLVNREVVAELDLSTQVGAGEVMIATGFYPGDERDGQATAYRDFAVWSAR